MINGVHQSTIPGAGTFFVGIDIPPGRYRCENGKGGWWVRFSGSGGDQPVGLWPLPAGPAEVDIDADDFAFETHVPTIWRLVAPAAQAGSVRRELRPVADPSLRPELDRLISRRRPLLQLTPLTGLAACFLGFLLLGPLGAVMLIPLALVALMSRQVSEDAYRARALRLRRDRYLTPEELDEDGQALLSRVQTAIDAVQDSEVNREGLLDTVDNAVTLPQQEWEIAQVLARQSALRDEQSELLGEGIEPEVEAAMQPLREKLDLSVRAVTRRIEALEHYADRTRAADQAFRAHHQLTEITARAHVYDELVADTVRDDLAVPAIQRLAEQSDELVRTLRSRLTEATEAATELPAP
ncbi:MAG: hypothetical protein JWN52_6172 [Actinomycetia bacterium]|nr:hypothetical protein [Actinomycetes bacterium]